MNASTYDLNRAGADSTVITEMGIREINIWESASGGIKWQTRPDTKREITKDLDYIYYNTDNPSGYDNSVYYPEAGRKAMENIDVTKRTPMAFIVGKLDYVYQPLSTLTLETGIKAVISNLDNNVLVKRWKNDSWQVDPVFTSEADLRENIGAAYISAKWQNQKGLHLSGGLRYEQTSRKTFHFHIQEELQDRHSGISPPLCFSGVRIRFLQATLLYGHPFQMV